MSAVVNWSQITSKLGLPKDTLAALGAFRKRAAEAKLAHSQALEHQVEIDFAHYRSILKNTAIVDEGEKLLKSFKPVDYDVSAQIKAISAFEEKALSSAKAASSKIGAELEGLHTTLDNIEGARAFDELTLADLAKAKPEIEKTVEAMVKKGKWTVPGYIEKFGSLSAL